MNILYYMEPKLYSRFGGGGVSMVAYYLSKALAKEVTLTYYPAYVPRSYASNLLKVYIGLARGDFNIIHFNFAPSLRNGGLGLFGFAKMTGAATLLNIHGIIQLEYLIEQPHTRKFRSAMYRNLMNTLRVCKRADQIVVNSEYIRNNVVVWYGINRDKIAVIPNGVDLKMFAGSNDKIMLEGDPSVLYVGHLARLKGVDILIQAITKLRSELPNIKLHLVGGGNDRYFALLAKKEGIEKHVVFHGWAKHSMLPSYYKSADICVFPSRHEGFGLVILEAMASGTPVIASNIPSFQEIISNGSNGRLFKPEDADALSKAILALSQDSDLRKRISSNALKTVTNYSWENIARKYVSLYKDLIE